MAARGRYYPPHGYYGRWTSLSTVLGQVSKTLSSLSLDSDATTASSDWVVGNHSYLQGTSSSFSVAATGPSTYVSGGIYGTDSGGASLPSGVAVSEAGLESYDGAGAATTVNGVYYTYHEPGALPTLTLHPTATATLPYMATWYPLEGAVPSGQNASSPDDANLRGSILSTWDDGSAKVIVVAGETAVTNGVQKTIRLRVGAPTGTDLTVARIRSIVTSVAVNFGAGTQTLDVVNTAPERTWWANPSVVCCRWRLSCGLGSMEAVIDIHAFKAGVSNRALVEVVIENGRMNCDAATVTAPSTQTYTNATVAVNGATIATVSSPTASMAIPNARNSGTYAGGHEPFRAWYCSTWVGGNPGIDVTHDAESMQAHPFFFRKAVSNTVNLQTRYSQSYDTYVPWATCRLRMPGMSGGGEDEEIGLVTRTQAHYIITGDKYAKRALIETAKAVHSADFHWRHTDGTPPTRAQVVGKNDTIGNWPRGPNNEPRWGGSTRDGSHIPSISMVPFMCHPSPCFIECAQKELIWNHVNYNSTDGGHSYDQDRSRAWRARNYATTIFLTPGVDSTRKSGYRTALVNQQTKSKAIMDQAWNTYDAMPGLEVGDPFDNNPTRARFQGAAYMHWLVAIAWHSVANLKVLTGADQTLVNTLADRIQSYPLRWFNDASGYEWRGINYKQTLGILSGGAVNAQFSNLIQEFFWDVTGTPPSAPGPWINFGQDAYNWQAGSTGNTDTSVTNQTVAGVGLYYPEHAWAVLCCAVERGVAGAEAAWTKVYGTSGDGGITNFSTWLNGFGSSYAELNRFPRNK